VEVLPAYVAAGVALFVFGIPVAIRQQRFQPIATESQGDVPIDYARLTIVAAILIAAIAANVTMNLRYPALAEHVPALGAAVWLLLLATAAWRRPDWSVLPATLKGTAFLLCLVTAASLMPVERLPPAAWVTTLGLGFVSAVFDNIPLTKLALEQGGYDWGMLAYAVGFGGSMIWFGSSAGVALTNMFPEGRSVLDWLKHGWYVAVAYVVGFAVLLLTLGWHPHAPHP
jgi:hypothetical protein